MVQGSSIMVFKGHGLKFWATNRVVAISQRSTFKETRKGFFRET